MATRKPKKIAPGVRRLAPGRYEFRVTRGGVAISETFKAVSDAEAKQLHRKWLVGVDEGRVRPSAGTIADLLDRYIELKKTQGRAATTIELYRGITNRYIAPRIGRLK